MLSPGSKVEVRTAYDRSWARGFEVIDADAETEQYRLRRLSDGRILPTTFDAVDVRREQTMWWV